MPSSTFSGTVSTPKLSVAVDMGNPFLNVTVDAFLKIGAVGVVKSVAEDTYKAIDKAAKYHLLLHGSKIVESLSKSTLEHGLKKLCQEGAYWGAAGGVYIGAEYGIERIRGSRDWKNAMLAGAATGAVLSAVSKKGKADTVVIDAILGGALATASQFLNNHYFC